MLKRRLSHYKPGVATYVHHLVAALIWFLVGSFLMVNGFLLMSLAGKEYYAFPALAFGTLKGLFILDKVAKKNITRIDQMHDGACIGSVYSVRSWLLVIGMIVLGRFLRSSVLPGEYVGCLYMTVGWGLFFSSRLMWRIWFQSRS